MAIIPVWHAIAIAVAVIAVRDAVVIAVAVAAIVAPVVAVRDAVVVAVAIGAALPARLLAEPAAVTLDPARLGVDVAGREAIQLPPIQTWRLARHSQ
jgi:hypothetical protein